MTKNIDISYDGHFLYASLPNYQRSMMHCEMTLLDMAGELANLCKDKGIELIARSAEIRDDDDGGLTIRYIIKSIA